MLDAIKNKIRTRMRGVRTFLTAGAFGLVGVSNLLGGIDLAPLLRTFVSDEKQLGAILVLIAVTFAVLRYVTSTPPGSADQDAPVKSGVDAGS